MPKKALGRGLGDLLLGNSPQAPHEAAPTEHGKRAVELGPGLRVLVLDKSGAPAPRSNTPPPAPRESGFVLKISLLAADAALLVLSLLWWKSVSHPLSVKQALTLIFSIGLGAWLGGLAVWLQFRRK